MKTPAELAARLRKMVLAAQHHYSPTGEPLRSIVVTPEWLEDMADAANALESGPLESHDPARLEDVEQYRIQMAAICTAALGYWEEGHGIHPAYDTPALRDVAKLYEKYAALQSQHAPTMHPVSESADAWTATVVAWAVTGPSGSIHSLHLTKDAAEKRRASRLADQQANGFNRTVMLLMPLYAEPMRLTPCNSANPLEHQ